MKKESLTGFCLEMHDCALYALERLDVIINGMVVPPPQRDWFSEEISRLRYESEQLRLLVSRLCTWADASYDVGLAFVNEEDEAALFALIEEASSLNDNNKNDYLGLPKELSVYSGIPDFVEDFNRIERELIDMKYWINAYLHDDEEALEKVMA